MTGIETATLAWVSAGATAVGTAVSAIGAIQQGKAAKQAAEYNAAIADRNAVIARQNAKAQAEKQRREARLRRGTARAAIGASGVTLEGSALDVLEDNALEEEIDRLTILREGELRASGFEASAALDRFSGANAERAGRFKAFGTVLEGAGSLAGSSAARKLTSSTPKNTSRVTTRIGTL